MTFFENDVTNIQHSLWCEKYRPVHLNDYIGNEPLRKRIAQYIEEQDIPHLLLYGKQGTGKTTLAKLIVKSIECDPLIINASDENNVETVRSKIKSFASSMGFKPLKIVILDECDYLTANAQAILRNLMETYSEHCRFILTCNYIEKIIPPIQSRCQDEHITPPTKKDVYVHMAKILSEEKVEFDPNDIVMVVDASYPDIRKAINTIQRQSKSGSLKIDSEAILESDFKMKVVELLKSNDRPKEIFKNIRQLVADNRIQDFSDMYRMLYDKVDDYAGGKTTTCILLIADATYKDALVIDKEIAFMACIIQILSEIK